MGGQPLLNLLRSTRKNQILAKDMTLFQISCISAACDSKGTRISAGQPGCLPFRQKHVRYMVAERSHEVQKAFIDFKYRYPLAKPGFVFQAFVYVIRMANGQ